MNTETFRNSWLACLTLAFSLAMPAQAGEVRVAVASNFTAPMERIVPLFEQATGHKAKVSYGSTGKFYAQIRNGAPYDVFLAADDETPKKLVRQELAVGQSRFVYALGKLVLWSVQPDIVDDKATLLNKGNFNKLSIANPRLAPYGVAAKETLTKLTMWNAMQRKLVQGENITQAYQFVASENADLGFIALSQIMRDGKISQGSWWIVPPTMYQPIKQSAVQLSEAQDVEAAQALLTFLRGKQAAAIIRSYGYELP
ncbi:MAG: molybdate ABC transporter substrate-binding protein [Gammaproteobacteria bacterium]|nr:molybdate ABC transporter substrate-binding protein [Gammaproteobacteria bacterium]MBU1624939.1 molybdate ABC transporter substrate-binding protein [Gammaproteobacteria bacterium]MBU1982238.1 molybdate ABC transporter substrate-binding protein [Gammaproteobacteria bacterium]